VAGFLDRSGNIKAAKLIGVSTDWQQAIKGFVLLAAVAIDLYSKRKSVK
jgi:ABC-type xylose transport system permease subunit